MFIRIFNVLVSVMIVFCVTFENVNGLDGQSPPSPSEVSSVVNSKWLAGDFTYLDSYITSLYSSFPNYIPAILAASFHDAVYEGHLSDAMQKVNQVKQWIEQNPEGVSDDFTFQLAMIEWGLQSEIDAYTRHNISESQLQPDPNAVRDACGEEPFPPIQVLEYCDFALIWYDSDWNYRKKITIQNTNVASDISDFPLYVKIDLDSGIGAHTLANGNDIVFTSYDGLTKIPHEKEYFNISDGNATGHFWVKIPNVYSSHNTDIYIYYGNPNASDGQDAAALWSAAGVSGVWHLKETSGNAIDSSGNGHDLTLYNTPTQGAAGKIGNCYSFTQSSSNYLQINNSIVSNFPLTLYCWIKVSSVAQANYMMPLQLADKDLVGPYWGLAINWYSNGQAAVHPYQLNGFAASSQAITADNWHQVVGVIASNSSRACYVDGGNKGTNTYSFDGFNADRFSIGSAGDSTPGWYVDGYIDEARIYNRVLTDAEVKFSYYNQNESDNELNWASEETK